jgi:hypothetical protein
MSREALDEVRNVAFSSDGHADFDLRCGAIRPFYREPLQRVAEALDVRQQPNCSVKTVGGRSLND